MIKVLKKNLIYNDSWLDFYQDEIEFADGTHGTYGRVDRKDGVVIVVVGPENKILLNKEYRYIINDYSWEIPGGGIDDGESPIDSAKRELMEETGIIVDDLENLGQYYPLSSLSNEIVWVFLAQVKSTDVSHANSEKGEDIATHEWKTFEEVFDMVDVGEITDALTANVVQMAVRRLNKS